MVGVLLRHAFAQALALCFLLYSAVPALGARVELSLMQDALLEDDTNTGGSDAVNASAGARMLADELSDFLAQDAVVAMQGGRHIGSDVVNASAPAALDGARMLADELSESLTQDAVLAVQGDTHKGGSVAVNASAPAAREAGPDDLLKLQDLSVVVAPKAGTCFADQEAFHLGCRASCICGWHQQCYKRVMRFGEHGTHDVGLCSLSVTLTVLSSGGIFGGVLILVVVSRLILRWNEDDHRKSKFHVPTPSRLVGQPSRGVLKREASECKDQIVRMSSSSGTNSSGLSGTSTWDRQPASCIVDEDETGDMVGHAESVGYVVKKTTSSKSVKFHRQTSVREFDGSVDESAVGTKKSWRES